MPESNKSSLDQVIQLLEQTRGLSLEDAELEKLPRSRGILPQLKTLGDILLAHGHQREANTIKDVLTICEQPSDLGGLGLNGDVEPFPAEKESEIVFLVSAWLESLNSADRSRSRQAPLPVRPEGRRGMTLSEKIFALHDVDQKGYVAPGDLIRVDVDWVIASEASWKGMEKTYEGLGRPKIFRNDRFWLAGDHVVDPRITKIPQVKALIDASERAKHVFKMTDYQGMNYTILHTEFYRERAQPGMMIIGSDSHTCSSGALGCLAVGLGAADVTLPLVTGETWFKVPESVNIRLVGEPKPGIGGKDVILYILQQLKRNTVAAERIVEYTGPGLRYLTPDARFAISNMTTELGGITGIFVPDKTTYNFIQKRRLPRHKSSSIYFQPDEDAQYAETHEIDLGNVRSFIAKYPKPDDVVPVPECEGMKLDGCFIGACTTAEEDLILGALVLEQGLKRGIKPVKTGNRKVVPGSLPILRKLRDLGLVDVYEQAGFEIGVPGCSYCVGMSADQAKPGEIWISSQNRNFENRMGKGSIGNLGSAATVAASSFEMKVKDPHELLATIDLDRWDSLRGVSKAPTAESPPTNILYVEPYGTSYAGTEPAEQEVEATSTEEAVNSKDTSASEEILTGKVQRLGDYIDTDALAPAEFLVGSATSEAIGSHCLEYTHPDFRQHAKDGFNIVVAGTAFGCGSSREQAVMALLGTGVKCVIAKSFAFIFQRNMPNLGLLGITVSDESFYKAAVDGADVSINLRTKLIHIDGKSLPFKLSQMERELFEHGGITSAFKKFGNHLFQAMTMPKNFAGVNKPGNPVGPHAGLQW
ncbi:aconitase family protein [Talaromyces proteolyticus]|uniref:Aconitase family protein n=1 Tax=Talaromyces proteolyticus TaxID=1131652 RepID=A0AAD4KL14_9EURO|nr:aconitase family protein [Talaromyces proteolyticus]KAH8691621.1 aconitase family protein [Talaromyces proteolyticus]